VIGGGWNVPLRAVWSSFMGCALLEACCLERGGCGGATRTVAGVSRTAGGRFAALREALSATYRSSGGEAAVAVTAVLIVDDQAPFRLAAAAVVEATPGFRVEAIAGSGEECVLLARRLHPDLVLMDVQLPGVNGWETSRLLRSLPSPPVVVVLSGEDVDDAEEKVLSSGAFCYIPKAAFSPKVLSRAWVEAQGGPAAVPP
jgi:CheY-like chemotaxis protein